MQQIDSGFGTGEDLGAGEDLLGSIKAQGSETGVDFVEGRDLGEGEDLGAGEDLTNVPLIFLESLGKLDRFDIFAGVRCMS